MQLICNMKVEYFIDFCSLFALISVRGDGVAEDEDNYNTGINNIM